VTRISTAGQRAAHSLGQREGGGMAVTWVEELVSMGKCGQAGAGTIG